MRVRRFAAVMGLSAMMFGLLGSIPVVAAPVNAPSATTDVATCTDGSTSHQYTIVSSGDEPWTPGLVVAIDDAPAKATFIPLGVSGTFYPDSAIDGQTEIELFTDEKAGNRNGVTNVMTCTLASEYFSADDPENPFGVGGNIVVTAKVFKAGNSH